LHHAPAQTLLTHAQRHGGPGWTNDDVTAGARITLTLALFGAMLALVVWRPRRWHEGWWTVLGAAAMLSLRLVSPHEAVSATSAGKSALLFLLALLLLSLFVEKSGFFEWAAIRSARAAAGNGRLLYRNAFLLGAVVTAVLSLDTTAVMLTPVLLSLVKRLRLPATPYIALCAFVANIGSLLLPISNLTNILFASAFNLTFAVFTLRMLAPQIVALAVTYWLLHWYFRRELPDSFDVRSLPEAKTLVPDARYFNVCIGVLAVVLLGYFLAPLVGAEPYGVAFGGSGVLLVVGLVTGRLRFSDLGKLSWGLFPFVIGLFIAVRGLENLGLVELCSSWLQRSKSGSLPQMLAVTGMTTLAANVTNNLPAAILARSVLLEAHAPASAAFAALIGADVGSIITPFGSLATMLVLAIARQEGVLVRERRILILAAWVAPLVVLASTLALALSFATHR
jgi:arsenical pump membrane protein